MKKEKWQLWKGNELKGVYDSEDEAYFGLQKKQPEQIDWAMRWEGWRIKKI
jgi:hypothetical protein